MRVPLLDLSAQYRHLRAPIADVVAQVLSTQQFVLGKTVADFETAICQYTGGPFALGVSSGTDALLAILMARGLGPGDALITTPYTFFATAGCIARVGATPLFVDIDRATLNLSPTALAEFLTTKCQRTRTGLTCNGRAVRAIVPVHLFGLCCAMDEISSLAAEWGLDVIEDAAQAIGAGYPSASGPKQAGTMGLAGYYSFYPTKNLGAAGDAGLIVTKDAALAERLRIIRQHGMEPQYFHQVIGGNFRLDALQAAILSVKLPCLDGWSASRTRVAGVYEEEFRRVGLLDEIALPSRPFRDSEVKHDHIFHQYVVRAPARDSLREYLREHEVGSAIYYPLGLHEQKCFAGLGYRHGDFPETERAAEETLALPMFPELTHEQQRYVVETMAEFYSGPAAHLRPRFARPISSPAGLEAHRG